MANDLSNFLVTIPSIILLTWFFLSITWSLINLIGNGVIIPVSYELKGVNVPEVNITFLGCWSLMKLNPAAGFRHWKLNIKSKRVKIKLKCIYI